MQNQEGPGSKSTHLILNPVPYHYQIDYSPPLDTVRPTISLSQDLHFGFRCISDCERERSTVVPSCSIGPQHSSWRDSLFFGTESEIGDISCYAMSPKSSGNVVLWDERCLEVAVLEVQGGRSIEHHVILWSQEVETSYFKAPIAQGEQGVARALGSFRKRIQPEKRRCTVGVVRKATGVKATIEVGQLAENLTQLESELNARIARLVPIPGST
uniref:CACTA en-spm transposon protein n=1 Tax=Steinernema glaseri TaxID=37863 RepID=A0A1I7Y4G9_9BILA